MSEARGASAAFRHQGSADLRYGVVSEFRRTAIKAFVANLPRNLYRTLD